MFVKIMLTMTVILNGFIAYLNIRNLEGNKNNNLVLQEIRNSLILKNGK